MLKRSLLTLCAALVVLTVPCLAQEQPQDSVAALRQEVRQLQVQLEQLTDLVIRLEARLRLQEQKTLSGAPSSRHQHRPVEITNFDNDVLRVVRGRCSVSQFGSTYTLTCR